MADLGGLLGNIDPSLLANLGLGLINSGSKNSELRGNWGAGLQQGLGNYQAMRAQNQQYQMGRLQMGQLQQEMPLRMSYLKALGQQLHVANNDPQTPAQVQKMLSGAAPVLPGAAPAPAEAAPPGGGASPGAPPSAAPAPSAAAPATMGGGLGSDPLSLMRLGAFGGALGMPGAQGLQELGKTQLQYDPKIATRMEAAKSQTAIDQQQIQDALSQGNTALAAGIAQKMRQDLGLLHIASMSGTQTRIGLDGNISTFNPNEGVQSTNGIESAIPGAAQARGEIAGAVARGEATGQTVELTDPNTGAKYLVPKSYVTGGNALRAAGLGPGAGAPTGGAAFPGAPAGLSPARAEMLKGNAQAALETNKEFQQQAENGQQMVAQTQTILQNAKNFTPGRFADTRATMLDYLNATGLITPKEKNELANYQEGQKLSIQLQAIATKQLGSREAAQVFEKMGKSLPSLTLSQQGLQQIGAWQMGISRYQMARAAYANDRAQQNDAMGVNSTRDTWIKSSNPLYFVMASADPGTRERLLSSVKDPKKFVADWNRAANNGLAPRPGEYASE